MFVQAKRTSMGSCGSVKNHHGFNSLLREVGGILHDPWELLGDGD